MIYKRASCHYCFVSCNHILHMPISQLSILPFWDKFALKTRETKDHALLTSICSVQIGYTIATFCATKSVPVVSHNSLIMWKPCTGETLTSPRIGFIQSPAGPEETSLGKLFPSYSLWIFKLCPFGFNLSHVMWGT